MKLFGAQNMYSELKTVLMKKPNPFMSKADSKKWNYDISLNQELIEKNYSEFRSIIENFGSKIIELKIPDKKV